MDQTGQDTGQIFRSCLAQSLTALTASQNCLSSPIRMHSIISSAAVLSASHFSVPLPSTSQFQADSPANPTITNPLPSSSVSRSRGGLKVCCSWHVRYGSATKSPQTHITILVNGRWMVVDDCLVRPRHASC